MVGVNMLDGPCSDRGSDGGTELDLNVGSELMLKEVIWVQVKVEIRSDDTEMMAK